MLPQNLANMKGNPTEKQQNALCTELPPKGGEQNYSPASKLDLEINRRISLVGGILPGVCACPRLSGDAGCDCRVIDGKSLPGCSGCEPQGGKYRSKGKDFILSRNH